MGQTYSVNGPPGGQFVTGMGGTLTATWETRYPLKLDGVVEIWQVGGSRVHPAHAAAKISHGSTSGSIVLNGATKLAVGSEYFLKWKTPDGFIFSGKLFAISEPFKVQSMQSIMMEQEIMKNQAKVGAYASKSAKAERRKFEFKKAVAADVANIEAAAAAVASGSDHQQKLKQFKSMLLLTKAERKVFRKYFDLVDTDGDESLSAHEILDYMHVLGFDLHDNQLKTMMSEADVNSDGGVDFGEFCQVMKLAEDCMTSKAWMNAQAKIGEELFGEQRTTSNSKEKRKSPRATAPKKTINKKTKKQ